MRFVEGIESIQTPDQTENRRELIARSEFTANYKVKAIIHKAEHYSYLKKERGGYVHKVITLIDNNPN